MFSLARTRSASSSSRLWFAFGICAQEWCPISWPASATAAASFGQLSMVKPGVNQVALMPRSFRNVRMRPDAMAPNSPRDSGVGVVMPRAMKPDWVSKSKVRQTMWRGMISLGRNEYNTRHGDQNHRHYSERRDRSHLLNPARGECAGADPRRGRAAGGRRSHRAAADAGGTERRETGG